MGRGCRKGTSRSTRQDEGTLLDQGGVSSWDTTYRKLLREWQFPGLVSEVAWSPDGRNLATANGNGNGTGYILRLPGELVRDGK